MSWKSTTFLAALLIAVGSTHAGADSVGYDAVEAHAQADKNGNGLVDRREFHDRMTEIFYHDDADKDGYLVVEELRQIDEEIVFEPADRNNDDKVSLPEYVDQRFEGFDEADVNGDGGLSVQEVIDAYGDR
jgi:Ca2+-binding EF-hand superfamily protein